MVYQRLAGPVLAQWRAIERKLDGLNPMSPEADELKLESYGLRNYYHQLIAEAIAHLPPEALPFPQPTGGHDFGTHA